MRFFLRSSYLSLIGLAVLSGTAAAADPFYMGGDISLLPFIDSHGGSFRDNGQVMPAEQIMVDHGANVFRLRLFVNPNPDYSATAGAIQDLNSTIAMAQRLKASGAKILLDFHYSDSWADPGKQAKPGAWANLSWTALNTTIRNYTRDSLLAMKNAGVMPDMVQVGNEVTNGMDYGTSVNPPNGGQVVYTGTTQTQNMSWANFGSLLNNAIAGVRDVDAMTPGQHTTIAIHCDGGNVNGRAQYYFGQITGVAGVSSTSFDVMGMSFYPANNGSTSLNNLSGNLNYLATHYNQKVMVLETNNPWKGSNVSQWASTPAGQEQFLADVRNTVQTLPNNRGGGVVWWYPESIPVPGVSIWKNGAVAMFDDSGGDALPSMNELQLPAPTWNLNGSGNWSGAGNWLNGLPNGAGQVARFGTVITAPTIINVDSPVSVATMTFLSGQSYTIGGPSTLTLDNDSTTAPARIDVLGGSHTISAPLVLADNTEINVAWTNSLSVSGSLAATGKTITKLGSGTAQFENIRAAKLDVQFGTVKISPQPTTNSDDGVSTINTLSVGALGKLDLTNNTAVIDHAGSVSPIADVRQMLSSGRLYSSSATPLTRLGYTDTSQALTIEYALAGDANLDGVVDAADLGALATHWQSTDYWSGGDFDYNGIVDVNDLSLLAMNWQSSGPSLAQSLANLGLPPAVPEPTGLAVTLVAGCVILRRCRKFEG